MNRIIVNADDLGLSQDINHIIIESMKMGYCKDATLFATCPDTEQAVELVHENGLTHLIGIHLNLDSGFPLTAGMKSKNRFCNGEGRFHWNRKDGLLYLSSSEKTSIYSEIIAQIQRLKKLGIPVSHADSHHHIHELPVMFPLIVKALKSENIPYLRIARNMGRTSLFNSLYRNTLNQFLHIKKLSGTHYFGTIADYHCSRETIQDGKTIEIMIHPGKITNGRIMDTYTNDNLTEALPGILEGNQLVSYSDIRSL